MKKIASILAVGADPEVMLFTKDGQPRSVEGLLGGTKDKPIPMAGLGEGFFVQEDNVAAEFNIPPCTNGKAFSQAIKYSLNYINKEVAKHGLTARCVAAIDFPIAQLMTQHAQTLGCEPDYNAWLEGYNPRPVPPEQMRTAAGHVHVSWAEPDHEQKIVLIKTMDLVLGVPSILATEKNGRRELYGKAGACRLKKYGAEYRTLDNFWLADDLNCKHVFTQTIGIPKLVNKPEFIEELDEWQEEIQDCINFHDKDEALRLCQLFSLQLYPVSCV